jgi:hypothetical protein
VAGHSPVARLERQRGRRRVPLSLTVGPDGTVTELRRGLRARIGQRIPWLPRLLRRRRMRRRARAPFAD